MGQSRDNNTVYRLDDLSQIILAMGNFLPPTEKLNVDLRFIEKFLDFKVKVEESNAELLRPKVIEIFKKLLDEENFTEYHSRLRSVIADLENDCKQLRTLIDDAEDHGKEFIQNLHNNLHKPAIAFKPFFMQSGVPKMQTSNVITTYQLAAQRKSELRKLVEQCGLNTPEVNEIYIRYLKQYIACSFLQVESLEKMDDQTDFDQLIYLLDDIRIYIHKLWIVEPVNCQMSIYQYARSVNHIIGTLMVLKPSLDELNTIEGVLRITIDTVSMTASDHGVWFELSLLHKKMAQLQGKQGQVNEQREHHHHAFTCLNRAVNMLQDLSKNLNTVEVYELLRTREMDLISCGLQLIRLNYQQKVPYSDIWYLTQVACERARDSLYRTVTTLDEMRSYSPQLKEKISRKFPFDVADLKAHYDSVFQYQLDLIHEWLDIYIPLTMHANRNDIIHYTNAITMELNCLEKMLAVYGGDESHTNPDNNNNNNNNSGLAAKLRTVRMRFAEKKFELVERLSAPEGSDVTRTTHLALASEILLKHMEDQELSLHLTYRDRKADLFATITSLQSEVGQSQQPSFGQALQMFGSPIASHAMSDPESNESNTESNTLLQDGMEHFELSFAQAVSGFYSPIAEHRSPQDSSSVSPSQEDTQIGPSKKRSSHDTDDDSEPEFDPKSPRHH